MDGPWRHRFVGVPELHARLWQPVDFLVGGHRPPRSIAGAFASRGAVRRRRQGDGGIDAAHTVSAPVAQRLKPAYCCAHSISGCDGGPGGWTVIPWNWRSPAAREFRNYGGRICGHIEPPHAFHADVLSAGLHHGDRPCLQPAWRCADGRPFAPEAMSVSEGRLEPATREEIDRLVRESWGLPIVAMDRLYEPADLEGLVWRDESVEIKGLVTWAVEEDWAEIVTMDAFVQGAHIGGRLLDAAEAELRERGVRTLVVVTTNDNLRAQVFYMRRGYRLTRLDVGGMDRVRALKPTVPATGHEGIPLRDMWEFRKQLT